MRTKLTNALNLQSKSHPAFETLLKQDELVLVKLNPLGQSIYRMVQIYNKFLLQSSNQRRYL